MRLRRLPSAVLGRNVAGERYAGKMNATPGKNATSLFGMTLPELTGRMVALGQKPFRARQMFEALYKGRVGSVEGVRTLSQELRDRLIAEGWSVGLPEIVQTATSVDGTERYLMRMADGETVETVWMPDGDGGERGDGSEAAEEEVAEIVAPEEAVAAFCETQIPFPPHRAKALDGDPDFGNDNKNERDNKNGSDNKIGSGDKYGGNNKSGSDNESGSDSRGGNDNKGGFWERRGNGRARSTFGKLAEGGFRRATICISSQVGCAVNCQFCLTAKLGIRRNLTAGEIAGQVAAVLNRHGIQIGKDRINLVFMGMGEPFLNYENFMASVRLLVEGIGIPESRMTVSTSGILPGMVAFAGEKTRPKLALSLNASNDEVRERIMPITRKWKIGDLLAACRQIPLRTREWVTFEYVLLGGVNDRPEHAREVLELLRGMRAKVNLIVWNPGPGIDYTQPRPEDVARFQKLMIDGGMPTYIRRPRGRDIYAACGQLKRTVSEERPQLVEIGAAVV